MKVKTREEGKWWVSQNDKRSVERRKRRGNSISNDKSSMAGELMPRTQNRVLDHFPLLSWENLELHQLNTCTHTSAHTYAYAFSMG